MKQNRDFRIWLVHVRVRQKINVFERYCVPTQFSESDLRRLVESGKNAAMFHRLDNVLDVDVPEFLPKLTQQHGILRAVPHDS